jgi:glutathione S-transferase
MLCAMPDATVHHIPVCPFSQRLKILLALKDRQNEVVFHVVDITKPRSERLLKLSRGTTALPIMEFPDGRVLRESLVLLQYLEDRYPERPVAQRDPWRRAVENMLTRMEGDFTALGYTFVLNQDLARREALCQRMLTQYAQLNEFLVEHAPTGPFLFEQFGWAEAVFTPMFMRFWFLDYYEHFELPATPAYLRVRQWRDACIAHPAAQQCNKEEIVKLYYDYARGAGNGALLPGREKSSFVFEPDWRSRPWPPSDKYGPGASDEELGL